MPTLPLPLDSQDDATLSSLQSAVVKTPHAGVGARLARGTAIAVLLKSLAAVAALVMQLALARSLGAHVFGEFTLALSLIAIAALIVKTGWDQASQRFVPEYLAQEDGTLLTAFRRVRFRAVLRHSLLGMLVAFALWWLVGGLLSPTLQRAIAWGIAALPIVALLDIASADLRARHRLVWSETPQLIARPLLLATLIVLIGYNSLQSISTTTALAIWSLVTAGMLVVVSLADRRQTAAMPIGDVAHRSDIARSWWQTALPLWWIAACSLWQQQADVILVGFLIDAEAAGVYSIAARIATTMTLGVVAINTVGAPLIAEQFTLQRGAVLQQTVRRMAWGGALLMSLAVLSALVLGPWMLAWFGAGFGAAYGPLVVLAVGQLLSSVTGSVHVVLAMTGHQQVVARVMSAFAVLHLLLAVVLVPFCGVLGAAIATSLTLLGWNCVLASVVWRRLQINPTILGRQKGAALMGGYHARA